MRLRENTKGRIMEVEKMEGLAIQKMGNEGNIDRKYDKEGK